MAFGAYRWDEEAGCHRAAILDVIGLRGDRIADGHGVRTPEVFSHFGLPGALRP